LVGTMIFAAVAPYLSQEAHAAKCGPRGDENEKEPGCGHQPTMRKPPRPV